MYFSLLFKLYNMSFSLLSLFLFYTHVAVHHPNIVCDACRKSDIEGMRFKCLKCMDFDLCTNCYMNSKHEMNHKFVLLETPDSPR